jgi:uncharacterized protein (TIGR03083 family)
VSQLLPDAEVSQAYVDLRARVVALLRETPEQSAIDQVPHCPTWTVNELASHLLGVPDDIVHGRMEGVGSDAWTQAQVVRHQAKTLRQIADELAALAERFDPMLPHVPAMARSQMVMDAVTHEHDLRHALGAPGERDSMAVRAGLAWLMSWCTRTNPATASAIAAVGASDFDVLRSLTGRRSAAQMVALGLPADAMIQLQAGSPFRAPIAPINE